MNKEEIIEGNKLIALFMGATLTEDKRDQEYMFEASPSPEYAAIYWRISQMKYHSSWDWLMPVVEKILKNQNKAAKFTEQVSSELWYSIFSHQISINLLIDINLMWQAVVQFIQWYNTTQTPKP